MGVVLPRIVGGAANNSLAYNNPQLIELCVVSVIHWPLNPPPAQIMIIHWSPWRILAGQLWDTTRVQVKGRVAVPQLVAMTT